MLICCLWPNTMRPASFDLPVCFFAGIVQSLETIQFPKRVSYFELNRGQYDIEPGQCARSPFQCIEKRKGEALAPLLPQKNS